MKDNDGKAYALVSNTKAGDILVCDGDFTCLDAGACRDVKAFGDDENYPGELYIDCDEGQHSLAGQVTKHDDDAEPYYIGLYHKSEFPNL